MPDPLQIIAAMRAQEPLFLLHTGDAYGNERGAWDVQADSFRRVVSLCESLPPGKTLPLVLRDDAQLDALAAEVERLTRELAEARADAERYRWLRMQAWWDSPLCVVRSPKLALKLGSDCPSLRRLDAAIDTAKEQSNG